MKIRAAATVLAASLVGAAAFAQTPAEVAHPLTQHDRDFAISSMQATRKLFLDSVANLTPEQWAFKAGPDRWSIAECAEHIAISEEFISGIARNLLKTPSTPEKRTSVKVTDEQIVKMVPDRTTKFKAPEPIAPANRWPDPKDAVSHFKEVRDKNIAYIESTQDSLRDHFMAHPAFGLLDAYQWMLLLSAHTERHTMQILDVKADPKFPK